MHDVPMSNVTTQVLLMRKSLHIVCNYYVLRTYAMNNKLVLHNVNTSEVGRVSFMLRMHKKEVVGSAKYISYKIKKIISFFF